MRVYLAGPYAARELISGYATALTEQDIECTSTWLLEKHEINQGTTGAATGLPDAEVDGHARQDIADIERSDALVLFTSAYVGKEGANGSTGGRHVETGYALARAKRVLVVGEPENVFHRLVTVERYDAWGIALHRLIALAQLEGQISRERAEATARADADARRVIDLDRYPGEPTGPDAA